MQQWQGKASKAEAGALCSSAQAQGKSIAMIRLDMRRASGQRALLLSPQGACNSLLSSPADYGGFMGLIFKESAINAIWAGDTVKDAKDRIRALPDRILSPCDVCKWAPPTGEPDKPCISCPAEMREIRHGK